jgi:hypothetical protein
MMAASTRTLEATPMSHDDLHDDGSADEKGFLVHVLIGMAVGLPVFVGLIVAALKSFTTQDMEDILGVAGWAGMWAALFLGGGAGAGYWLIRNEH